jgi:hypothetical protein
MGAPTGGNRGHSRKNSITGQEYLLHNSSNYGKMKAVSPCANNKGPCNHSAKRAMLKFLRRFKKRFESNKITIIH